MAASTRIRDVWTINLDAEMRNIRETIERFPYVALDTEFPGVVARPIGPFKTQTDYHYQTMRCNVDLLKIIQIGLTFSDEDGNTPPETSTWQFNFHFSVKDDIYRPESIELLQKAGIDFERHEEVGILPNDFAELMITSGLVLAPETKWISFHSPYDFGYFVRLLTAMSLPTSEDDFFELLRMWFPSLFDIKVMMRVLKEWRGGLQDLADELGVARIGTSHQAGSDSLLTSSTFFKVREAYFHDGNEKQYNGILYGIGSSWASLGVGAQVDTARTGVTPAEREDRSSARELMGQATMTSSATPSAAVPIMPAIPNSPYGALNGPYLRTAMVGGGR